MDEHLYFSDDEKLVADMLAEGWSLGWDDRPTIAYERESYMMNAHVGAVFVYSLSYPTSISTTDYRTMRRRAYVSVKLSTRRRDRFYEWGQEIYRIILENRRSPALRRNGWTFMEVTSKHNDNSPSGWYSATFDIRFTAYNQPIRSSGFGNVVQRPLPPWMDCADEDPGTCDAGCIAACDATYSTDPGECPQGDVSAEDVPYSTDPGECPQEDVSACDPTYAEDPGSCIGDGIASEDDEGPEDPGTC